MNNLKIFKNAEFGQIRTVVIDGEPWFVGRDVAGALEYNEPHKAVVKHVMEEDRTKYPILTDGGLQEMWVINESGLYSLILSSKMDSAKRFKHWVTAEVLPSIHKTGKYEMENQIKHIPLTESPGEVARLINATARLMERQGSEPYKVAENAKLICTQYGIRTIEDFVKVPEYVQMHLSDFLGGEKNAEA